MKDLSKPRITPELWDAMSVEQRREALRSLCPTMRHPFYNRVGGLIDRMSAKRWVALTGLEREAMS